MIKTTDTVSQYMRSLEAVVLNTGREGKEKKRKKRQRGT
jgi:hypothetical protein